MTSDDSRAAVFSVVMGVCMILLMMPRVSASTASSCSGVKRAQPAAHAVNLSLANGLQVLLQRNNGRHDIEGLQARLELVHLQLHDGFGAIGFGLAIGDVRRHHLLQVVDVVNEDAVQLVHLRIDVARDRDIDEEHGTVLAAAQELFAVLLAEDGVRRAGGADDDVGLRHGLVELFEGNRLGR